MKQTITTPEQLSLIIQSARKGRGLTQSDMAGALDLSQASLSRLELNTQNMKVTQLLTLCKRLGLELVVQDRTQATRNALPSSGDKADW
jgi:HTH-type transcriptional regulator / antitoxin HipB